VARGMCVINPMQQVCDFVTLWKCWPCDDCCNGRAGRTVWCSHRNESRTPCHVEWPPHAHVTSSLTHSLIHTPKHLCTHFIAQSLSLSLALSLCTHMHSSLAPPTAPTHPPHTTQIPQSLQQVHVHHAEHTASGAPNDGQSDPPPHVHDVVIVGAGMSGMSVDDTSGATTCPAVSRRLAVPQLASQCPPHVFAHSRPLGANSFALFYQSMHLLGFVRHSPTHSLTCALWPTRPGVAAAAGLLSLNVTDFVLLEARSYTGGRVHAEKFGDGVVEVGANWVHGVSPNSTANPIWNAAQRRGIKTVLIPGSCANVSDYNLYVVFYATPPSCTP
jgi:hypothetical protein